MTFSFVFFSPGINHGLKSFLKMLLPHKFSSSLALDVLLL